MGVPMELSVYMCYLGPTPEEVVHASLSVTAMSRVQQNLLFSSTYLQPTGRGDGALQVLVAGLWQGL